MVKQVKRKSAGIPISDGNRKRGRSEMRKVTRTAARKPRDAEDDNELDSSDQLDEEIVHQENEEKDEDEDEEDEDSGKAYSALLTLLKSDHKENKDNAKSFSIEEQPQQSEDEDEVAGVVSEDEQEGEEDQYVSDNEEEEVTGLASDPFEVHFNLPSDDYLNKEEKLVVKDKEKWPIVDKKTYSDLALTSMLQLPPGELIEPPLLKSTKLSEYSIKKRVLDAYEQEYGLELSELESLLVNPILNYRDVNYQYKTFANKNYRRVYIMHALNHICKTRDRILKNTTKLHANKDSTNDEDLEFRDQGFTRPKVLILLPTRNACYEVVEQLIKLSGTDQQENKKKFNDQFYAKEMPPNTKPEDFRDAFRGNNSDFFCIGLKLTRKSLKLYSSFYSSDIILASPIGLSMILENPDKKKRQYDFLSSIEVLIVDKSNQIEMQNWDHVNTVMKYINKVPKEFHDADFSRIRMWSINDQAKLLRQTLVFCEYLTPSINNLVSSKSFNLSGKVKFKPIVTSDKSMMNSIRLKIKQIFQRFDSASPMQDPDARFKFFINTILPSLLKTSSYEDGIMIFIPSYFDYLRVKNYLKTSTKFDFASIDEYTSQSKLTRARQGFASGKIKVMLYTERLHYFRRYEISGVKTLIMYALPSNPLFYKELIRFIGKSVFKEECELDLALIKILFSKWDAVNLEKIVGNERAPILCNSMNELYEFR
ncbi:U3 small nucleolar RNA-associated protein 25 [Candida viswanathii]|uniref:U3 small nucleolar RNA-associated protein 25 n=1 Tax=Candida viswanathii TaxID=5486 RepID=A0A367Y154_9ASCO|nr:U3 small nucleolar RNA-associated protein 25 [Candida viswanathii]